MSLSSKLRRAPGRIVTGAFILDQGITKLTSQDEETAKHLHGAAKGAYPAVEQVQPRAFMKTLGAAEVTLGAALLLPVVPAAVAGAGLVAFSGALLTMWWRTPGMHQEGNPRPTPQGTALAKDSWMLGIGAGLLLDDVLEGTVERGRRKAALRAERAKAEAGRMKAEADELAADAKRMKAEAKAAAKGRQVGVAQRVGELKGAAIGTVGQLAGTARGTVGELKGGARGTVGELKGTARGTVGELKGTALGLGAETTAKGRELLATGKQRGAELALGGKRMKRRQKKKARKQARAASRASAEIRRTSAELAKRTAKAAQDTAKAAQDAVKDAGEAARGAVESLTS